MKLSLFILLAFPSIGLSANHYVRPDATGSASGDNWTDAYTSIPVTLTRGDTYYIADGSYGTHSFEQAGTTVTTVKKATASDHGTDTGWSSTYGDGQAVFQRINFLTGSGWVVDGNTRTGVMSGHGIKVDATIDPNEQFGIFFRVNTAMDNITVRYVEVEGRGLSDIVVYKGVYCLGESKTNITFSHSYLHDFGLGLPIQLFVNGFVFDQGAVVRNTSAPSNHSEHISSTDSDNVTLSNTLWGDADGTGIIVELNSGGNVSTAENWNIFGNTFYSTDDNDNSTSGNGTLICINGQICNNWKIYNNSFVNIRSGANTARICFDAGSGNEVKNNIWFNSGDATHCTTGLTADYNYYINTTHTAETNEQVSPTTDPFVNLLTQNFRLNRATIAGVTLGSPYNTDPDGKTRGADGTWDRGAYEYTPAGSTSGGPRKGGGPKTKK